MPVIVKFDVPVTDRASIEKNLHVVSQPAQKGSWHWISDNEVHWRPAHYWKPGTKVTVNADINGVPAGNGIYGQLDRTTTFHIGASHVYKVNIETDQLRVFDNGHLTRTIPVTTGMPGFTTRSGTKVIIEKDRFHTMNSETIGIDPNSANGYNIKDVEYAMRLTYSGEFLHAAPVVGGLPGPRERLPRLHRHEHRERRLALQPLPDRRRRRVHRLQRAHDPRQRLRRLERALLHLRPGLRPPLTPSRRKETPDRAESAQKDTQNTPSRRKEATDSRRVGI